MAKDMITEDYYGKREIISNDWQMKIESAKLSGTPIPDHPGFPPYPSETEVIAKAATLNGFVSNIPVETTSKNKKG